MKNMVKIRSIVAGIVGLFAGACTVVTGASAQTTVALSGITPKEVTSGSATLVGHYNPSNHLRLVIGLAHPHLADEKEFLKELQTKGSPNFQKFLTAAEWNSRFGPSQTDEQAVVDWANKAGLTVSKRYANRLIVDVDTTSGAIETALGVTINSYQVGTRTAFSSDKDPVIPASMSGIIHSIGGLNNIHVLMPSSKGLVEPDFPDYSDGPASATAATGHANAKAKRPTIGAGANITGGAYDPTDIYSSGAYDVNALYNQGHCCNPLGNSGVTPPASSIAIATAGSHSGSDFAGFQSAYPYLAYHYQEFYVDGTPTCCDGEGTLDFDWSTAWSNSFGSYQDTAMIYMYDGVNNQISTFTDVYNQILSDGHAKVFSTSWGCAEISCWDTSDMDTDDGIFSSMIGQGMTLVAASGDQGATAGCGDAVAVQFPASDPNIVGAGGNTLSLNSSDGFESEVAWSGGPDGCSTNDGGSTGGESAYYAMPSYQSGIGYSGSNRYVPDIALNADWYYSPQNFYYGGELQGNGGTSIVAPSVAGFFAQTNAYLDYVATINGGCYGATTCSAIGNGNWYLYYLGLNPGYAPHYPFYDITSGCNNNDVTSYYGLGYWCAGTGYDPVTGWGSFNALQLARAITTYRASDGYTTASFSGYTQPTVNHWYNTDQAVQWSISATGSNGYNTTGVAGYTADWDAYIYDSGSAPSPRGSGDSFYAGVEYPNSTYGYLYVSSGGQGCHTAQIRSWDNSGGGGYQTYGPVCYDTVAPSTTAALSGTLVNGTYYSAVKVTLTATDATSGVAHTYYQLDGGATVTYSGAFTVAATATGSHTLKYWSVDQATNTEATNTLNFAISTFAKAAMQTPAPGSMFTGTSVTFTWSTGSGATGYALWLGTTGVGSDNLYEGGVHTATSVTVNGLPNTGATIYARLYTQLNGALQSTDYTYKATEEATMTSPAAGSTLTSSSQTFSWTTISGATGYALWAGTTGVGSHDLYQGGVHTPTSLTLTGLPTNGSTIYVRLYTSLSGTLEYVDYTYKAASLAAITSPAQGSTFTSSSETFTWTTVSGATGYALWLGTTGVGSHDLYQGGVHNVSTLTVTGLPSTGATIYARLYTSIGGNLYPLDYTYKAASASAITSPAPSSTLAGPSVTFSWTTVSGASGYALWVGTTGVGSHNLLEGGFHTNTSLAVSGLPTNGSTVYVRLYTQVGSAQEYADYTYTAAKQAAITFPTPNTTLSGSSVTFQWAPGGSTATGYALWVGTTGVGSHDVYQGGVHNVTSLTVGGIPTNGNTVYVRLYTSFNGTLVPTDYTYTAQ